MSPFQSLIRNFGRESAALSVIDTISAGRNKQTSVRQPRRANENNRRYGQLNNNLIFAANWFSCNESKRTRPYPGLRLLIADQNDSDMESDISFREHLGIFDL